jgi:hypothetical protein
MSVAPFNFALEGKRFLVVLIYDLCVKKFGGGSISADDTTTNSIIAATDENLRHIYIEEILRKFGDKKTSTDTEEDLSSFCTTIDPNDIHDLNKTYNFFEMCVAMANIIFGVEDIDAECKLETNVILAHLRTPVTSVFTFLCDVIYSYNYENETDRHNKHPKEPMYMLLGKGLKPRIMLTIKNIKFDGEDPKQLIKDGILSDTTIKQLEKVNNRIREQRGLLPRVQLELVRGIPKLGWLSNSPTKCERVWTDILLAIILVAGPLTVSLTAFNSIFDFIPKLVFPHLSPTADWAIGIASGVLALGFAALDLFRIACSGNYQIYLFGHINNIKRSKCGYCKAFCLRAIGAHEKDNEPQATKTKGALIEDLAT